MKKIAFVLACILTISICLAGCQETEFDTGEGTPVFSLDANEISAVTFQNGNTGEKTIVSNRDEITEIADYLNAFRVYLYRTDESSRNYVTMMCVDANDVNSEVYYSPTAGFGTYKVVIEAYVSGGEISGDVVVNQCKNAPADPLE